ncbi:uncharacterized protein LOC131673776 [Phymastichus coffea]|uniref:uncharacterized protein LOC131673776 n=1 Tax=Phymastichus coffea TaxID=108790 RepID=UPI00273ACB90|nr:uncharacterized protein LOC131673776 [Phymastichus coffea]
MDDKLILYKAYLSTWSKECDTDMGASSFVRQRRTSLGSILKLTLHTWQSVAASARRPTGLVFAGLLCFLAGCVAASAEVWSQGRKPKAAQYHTQDSQSGAYQYGYTGPHHAKSESSFNGVTRGGYSYIDANGLMQTVSYTADAENGFRVQASNLPNGNSLSPLSDTAEVAVAKKRHLEQSRKAEPATWQEPQQLDDEQDDDQHRRQQQQAQPFLLSAEEARDLPAPRPGNANAIVVEAGKAEPVAMAARFSTASASLHRHHLIVPAMFAVPMPLVHSSMRHSQDSLGQYEYSYTGDTSAKTESRSLDGTTRGAYSYIDANGLLQQVHYIADKDGFRVLATNLPQA